MGEKLITATLHNLSPVPNGAIYQGDGMFEFVVADKPESTPGKVTPVTDVNGFLTEEPYNIEKKYAEYDPELKIYYKDPVVKVELVSDVLVAEAEKTEVITKTDVKIDEYLAAESVDAELVVKK